jgi:hypothetical protein
VRDAVRHRLLSVCLTCFALASLIPSLAWAEPPLALDAAQAKLTGAVARQWDFIKVIPYLDAQGSCQQGDDLRFSADHNLVIEHCDCSNHHLVNGKCDDGKLVQTTTQWTLRYVGPLHLTLSYDDKDFILVFKDKSIIYPEPTKCRGASHWLLLRVPGGEKGQYSTESIYCLSRDLADGK